ncbi:MAG TPA: pilus assembly protein TadG-related protein [Noviherbaspirillum sp.]|uniref:pilus assembly protein TadG-related protein n=1 Tax=Noviherbaspirillum sp. TaxID=1926288 RepID=UPI002D3EA482|nr:pilus assembly protein TadG-related protein [Noviherbaspirillum sp.]HYD95487.1 pilus assembly protein TadG-related protein [Noviherbaspirillum sp.]
MVEGLGWRRQGGAVIITTALLLLFLLGFAGIALDFGHLFVVRSELQTAMDSCALSAAQELDGRADALTRATSAGITAGNLNRVDLQSANWRGQGQVTAADIKFRNANFVETTAPAAARYVECEHTQSGISMWLLQAMGAFFGDTATYPATRNVGARAVATRASAQTTCAIPVALKPRIDQPPNYGFQVGEWITVYGNRTPGSGELGWYNLDGTSSAHNTRGELSEYCETTVDYTGELRTPGAQTGVHREWNYRFGIYRNNESPADLDKHPDFSGYSYTSENWKNPVPQNAWSGTPVTGSHPSAQNFLTKRARFASFDDNGTDLRHGSQIVFGNAGALNSYRSLATPGSGGEHQRFGTNRRVVLVPVLYTNRNSIQDFACMFMLHPLTGPHDLGHMEFLGNASDINSPCIPSGTPGGTSGPRVPVLVR